MIIREFISDFTKIKRTPWILLHLSLPIVITALLPDTALSLMSGHFSSYCK